MYWRGDVYLSSMLCNPFPVHRASSCCSRIPSVRCPGSEDDKIPLWEALKQPFFNISQVGWIITHTTLLYHVCNSTFYTHCTLTIFYFYCTINWMQFISFVQEYIVLFLCTYVCLVWTIWQLQFVLLYTNPALCVILHEPSITPWAKKKKKKITF